MEGKRLCTLECHRETINVLSFSPDNSKLITVGLDDHRRTQIIVWDVQLILLDKSNSAKQSRASLVSPANDAVKDLSNAIAKQTSDFHISSITFSPFEEDTIVSCGRENIRFYRIRKKHLPGRPILLGDHSRGYIFNGIAFYNDAGSSPKEARRPCAYFSSNKGVIIKVDCLKEQVICTYQLHSVSITSFVIGNGYAVTGSADNMLRVWPLDFSDFLMEAQHEGSVTSIKISRDGSSLLIGTAVGTLGVLHVSDHSYRTILRSHTKSILRVDRKGAGEEFATVSQDKTLRIWDLFTGQQRFEFSTTFDEPCCLKYHPVDNSVACGFESGYIRICDVVSTTTSHEFRAHKGPVASLNYCGVESLTSSLYLVSVGYDGVVSFFNASMGYEVVKTLQFSTVAVNSVFVSMSYDQHFLAVITEQASSLSIVDIRESHFILKSASVVPSPSSLPPIAETAETPAKSMNNRFADLVKGLKGINDVNGMSFMRNSSNGSLSLLLSTKKSLHGFPLSLNSTDILVSKTSEVVSKRVDFGNIASMIYDDDLHVAFLPLNSVDDKPSSTFALAKIEFIVTGGEHRLLISLAQVFEDHGAALLHATISYHHGKAVTVDAEGGMIIWDLRGDKLEKLRTNHISSSSREATIQTGNGTRRVQLNESVNPDEAHVLENDARTLLSAFESAVIADPTVWSADTVKSRSHFSQTGTFLTEDVDEDELSPQHSEYVIRSQNVTARDQSIRLEDMFEDDEIHENMTESFVSLHDSLIINAEDENMLTQISSGESDRVAEAILEEIIVDVQQGQDDVRIVDTLIATDQETFPKINEFDLGFSVIASAIAG